MLDTQLVGLAQACVLIGLLVVRLSHRLVVGLASEFSLVLLGDPEVQAVISCSLALLQVRLFLV